MTVNPVPGNIGWLSGAKEAEGNVADALGAYGYDAEVELHQLTTRIYSGGKEVKRTIPDHKAVVRMSDYTPLAVVGKDYNVVQHLEAFGVTDTLISEGQVEIEKVQSIKDGRKVMIVTRSPEKLEIAGEPITRYQAWFNSHDGKTPVMMVSTPTRDFCTNVLVGLKGIDRDAGSYKIKHTRTAHTRLAEAHAEFFGSRGGGAEDEPEWVEEELEEMRQMAEEQQRREAQGLRVDASQAMEREARYVMRLKAVGDDLAGRKMGQREFESFLKELVPIKPDASNYAVTVREEKRADIRSIFLTADDLNNVRDTYWSALQAVIMFNDHYRRYANVDTKVMSILNGNPDVAKALKLLMN